MIGDSGHPRFSMFPITQGNRIRLSRLKKQLSRDNIGFHGGRIWFNTLAKPNIRIKIIGLVSLLTSTYTKFS